MKSNRKPDIDEEKVIVVRKNGPYVVRGNVPLVRKAQVVSERGEPLAWQTGETIETGQTYLLCRCGQSRRKPFCDGSHVRTRFDGTESADTRATAKRQVTHPGGTNIVVKRDTYLCMDAGFCANRVTCVEKMVPQTDDTQVRSHVMAMIERCPSGSYVYALREGEADVEPDLPRQVAVTTETTWAGSIDGPLWVTGKIPIQRADGQPFEVRNRVTLCRCGLSSKKPLCDSTHRGIGVTED